MRQPRASSITAASALTNAGVDIDAVRRTLPSVEPHLVWFTPASQFARRFWAKGIVAITMPWAVYVTPDVFARLGSAEDAAPYGQLVVHELVHVEQFRTAGLLRHVVKYSADYMRGRWAGLGHWEAYRGVAAEVEARTIAAEFRPSRGPR